MKLARILTGVAAALGLALSASAVPATADSVGTAETSAATVPYPVCYGADAYVKNRYGQNAAYGKTGWCIDDRGRFETTTGWNSVKDLVNGDGVAARLYVRGTYQDGRDFEKMRAEDFTTTPGATTWGFDGYITYLSVWVCLGNAKPATGSAYCTDMSPSARFPW
ncbi:hypothetical protein [Streptomyces sp. NPDC050504]|uniref:hypothetical protein n=1 Tax=Streptomyces sp. NPDC050504 TaxID=3365618 RepID=UPI00379A9E45